MGVMTVSLPTIAPAVTASASAFDGKALRIAVTCSGVRKAPAAGAAAATAAAVTPLRFDSATIASPRAVRSPHSAVNALLTRSITTNIGESLSSPGTIGLPEASVRTVMPSAAVSTFALHFWTCTLGFPGRGSIRLRPFEAAFISAAAASVSGRIWPTCVSAYVRNASGARTPVGFV